MSSLIADLRYASRALARNPGFAAVAILVLALGIGANTAVFTVVNGVLLRPLPFPNSGRLVLISDEPPDVPPDAGSAMADSDYLRFRSIAQSYDALATFNPNSLTLTGFGEPLRLHSADVTTDFFRALGVNAAKGRTFSSGDQDVVLLSDALWRGRMRADPRILGATIKLDGVPRTVIGIMPAGLSFPYDAQVWAPFEVRLDPHNGFTRPVVGRLKPGVSPQQALAEVQAMPLAHPNWTRRIVPLKDLLVADIRRSLLIFAGAVAFVLLIACANVANLLLIRAVSREQEMAIRAALGAGRWRLARQTLVESTLLSLIGGAAGLLVALWGVPALLALAPDGRVPRLSEIRIDGPVLAFAFAISVLTGLIFGLAPAAQVMRRKLRVQLSGAGRTLSRHSGGLRSGLVAAEIALALVLLAGAGLMLKSFIRLRSVDPGFRSSHVAVMHVALPPAVYHTVPEMQAFHRRVIHGLGLISGVSAAGAVNWMPMTEALATGDFHLPAGRTLPRRYIVAKPTVTPGYFRAMGIRLLRGREFSERDTADAAGVIIVSERVAREVWPGEDPLGKTITMDDHPTEDSEWLTVVGVVEDIRQRKLTERLARTIYQPYQQMPMPFFLSEMTFVVRTAGDPVAAAPAMRAVLHSVDPDLPVQSIATMDNLLATTTAEPRFQARLLTAFSMLALLLAAIGIYGVLAYSVAERTREIGIRMALGAARADVIGMVFWRTLALAGAGIVLGSAGAIAATRVLAKLLFQVTPTDAPTFIAVAGLLGAVALLAALLPAWRATRVDPVTALRYE
jgi:putative ABC transport system permease protein